MKLKKKEAIFYIAYSIFFVSLFIRDIDIETMMLQKLGRYIAYALLLFQLCINTWENKELIRIASLSTLSILLFLISKDMYWASVVLVIFAAKDIEIDKLFKYTAILLFSLSCLVILLCIIGILPDIMTARQGEVAVATRHSLGFSHSNVLPGIHIYLMVYYLWEKNRRAKGNVVAIWFLTEIGLYYLCGSRNALLATIIVSGLFLVFQVLGKNVKIITIFEKIDYLISFFLFLFSFAMTFLISKGGIYDTIDTILSGRFRVPSYKIAITGVHLLNTMSNEAYFKDGLIIDNGYMYVILRYGILATIFYIMVNYSLVRKAEKSSIRLICILIIFLVNIIDNDLCDYNFLPFIICSFNTSNNIKYQRNKKGRTDDTTTYFSNNERL